MVGMFAGEVRCASVVVVRMEIEVAVSVPITVLIVDDDEIVRKLIRLMLRGSRRYRFLEANDASEALKIAGQHRGDIDLLLSEVVLAGRMNGTEMAAQMSQARPEMKVVLMSGCAPESLTMEPAWHFIQKPFSVSEIQERIGSILDRQSVVARS